MPELPDVIVYQEALARRLVGRVLRAVTIVGPAVLESVDPPITSLIGRTVLGIERLGKRLVISFEGELFAVVHLMIAGRLRWMAPGKRPPAKVGLAAFGFDDGTLQLVEASPKKRARIRCVTGRGALDSLAATGRSVFELSNSEFAAVLRSRSRSLKRALTDPDAFDGIGNAYSDEILHAARLSPTTLTTRLDDEACCVLAEACRRILTTWIERLRVEVGAGFPTKVTAFRDGMAVHGRHGEPCPTCATAVQRIVRGDHETNYCPGCQTGGRLLADRSLSRLDRGERPRSMKAKAAREDLHRRMLALDRSEPPHPPSARGRRRSRGLSE